MITPEEKKEMLTIFRKHYDNLKMRCDIDNATLMLVIKKDLPIGKSFQFYLVY